MLLFLATILEQLDLALEHVLERDIHNARFGLMLTDNALELVLHQIARDKVNYLRLFGGSRASYVHQAALDKALGRSFSDKVNFVRLAGVMSEEMAQTIGIMHGVRNEVYHVGLQHEAILPSLSLFYFNVACTYICSYKPPFLTWSSNQKLPARAKKYFRRDDDEFGEPDDFRQGCDKLALDVGHKPAETIAALADHFDEAIQQQDACIDTIAEVSILVSELRGTTHSWIVRYGRSPFRKLARRTREKMASLEVLLASESNGSRRTIL